jgi:hypothetical protein
MCLNRQWTAVAGTVFPLRNTNYDWNNVNDPSSTTLAWTLDSTDAYIEVDVGVGGKMTNNVFIDVGWVTPSKIHGVTLTIMDPTRYVIFQYTFDKLEEMSAGYAGINFNCPIYTISDPLEGQMVRYLRFERISDPEAINLSGMEAYQHNNPD